MFSQNTLEKQAILAALKRRLITRPLELLSGSKLAKMEDFFRKHSARELENLQTEMRRRRFVQVYNKYLPSILKNREVSPSKIARALEDPDVMFPLHDTTHTRKLLSKVKEALPKEQEAVSSARVAAGLTGIFGSLGLASHLLDEDSKSK